MSFFRDESGSAGWGVFMFLLVLFVFGVIYILASPMFQVITESYDSMYLDTGLASQESYDSMIILISIWQALPIIIFVVSIVAGVFTAIYTGRATY